MSAKERNGRRNNGLEQKVNVQQKAPVKTLGLGVRHLQMVCMASVMVVLYVVRAYMSVAVLAMTDQTRVNDTDITIFTWDKKKQGLILSSFSWTYFIMQVPSGLMAKKYGGKPLILFSLITNGLFCLLAPVLAEWGDWPMVCVARAAMGLTQSALMPSMHTLMSRWLPSHERNSLVGFVYGGTKIGTILALPLCGVLSDTAMGWKLIFYATGLLVLSCAFLWWGLAASSPGEHWLMKDEEREYIEKEIISRLAKKPQPTPWRSIITSRQVWAIASAHIGLVVYYTFFLTDLPTYMDKNLNMSLKKSAYFSTLPFVGMWIAGMIGSYTFGKLVTLGHLSIGTSRKIANSIAYFGVSAGLLALSYISPEHNYFAVAILVLSLSLGGFFVSGFLGNHIDLSPNYAGLLLSLTNSIATSAGFIVPLFDSLVLGSDPTNTGRWRIIFITIAAVTCILNIIYLMYGDCEIQPWDNPDVNDIKEADAEGTRLVIENNKDNNEQKTTYNVTTYLKQ